jgi:hypothetical protein
MSNANVEPVLYDDELPAWDWVRGVQVESDLQKRNKKYKRETTSFCFFVFSYNFREAPHGFAQVL